MTTFYLTPAYPAIFYDTSTKTGATIIRTINLQGGIPGKSAQNFTMWQSDSLLLNVAVTDASNNPVDITGATIEWVLQYNVASVSELVKKTTSSGITITDATNGKFQIELDSTDTAGNQFGAGNFYHQCRVVDVSGHGETVFIGNITMTASATTF